MDGWIKLWRKSIDSGLIKNHNVWVFWTYCLLKANHKVDYKQVVGFQEIILQPGQFIFGLLKASEETELSIQKIRTCLSFLKKCKNLTIKSTNKFSIISIVNWDAYQDEESESNKQFNKQVTSKQQTGNKQVTTNKNIRTKEPKKEDILFEKFWEMYAKKTDRKKCLGKFNRLKQSDIDSIFEKLPAYLESTPDPQYRKNPGTYLNNESWKNEIVKNGLNGEHQETDKEYFLRMGYEWSGKYED